MKDHVKILLLGDDGVGKSSLISTYVSRHFPEEVPNLMTDTVITADKTADDVIVTIMDSSSRPGDRDVLRNKILIADSILALYDATRAESLENIESEWLPLIQDLSGPNRKPVVIVGTKADLLSDRPDEPEETERLKNILSKFPFVCTCCRCSAKHLNVENVFYHGELVVTFPIAPLFDVATAEFTEPCRRAFYHIFRVFDENQDGLLDDEQLGSLQQKCFGVPFKEEESAELRKEVSKVVSHGSVGKSLTFEGFMGLISLFLDRSQPQTPWIILRRFGYDDNLNLELPQELEEVPALAEDEIFELSQDAQQFLETLAARACVRRAHADARTPPAQSQIPGVLTVKDMREIFSVLSPVVADDDAVAAMMDRHPWESPPVFQSDDGAASVFLLSESLCSPDLCVCTPFAPSISSSNNSMTASAMGYSIISNPSTSGRDDDRLEAAAAGGGGVRATTDRRTAAAGTNARRRSSSRRGTTESETDVDEVFCTVKAWLAQWAMLAVHRPHLVQVLLYRLGYVSSNDLGLRPISRTAAQSSNQRQRRLGFSLKSNYIRKSVLNVAVLGAVGVGKADLIRALSGLKHITRGAPQSSDFGTFSLSNVSVHPVVGAFGASSIEVDLATLMSNDCDEVGVYVHGSCYRPAAGVNYHFGSKYEGVVTLLTPSVSIALTAVPYGVTEDWLAENADCCDVVILVIDCGDLYGVGAGADAASAYITLPDTDPAELEVDPNAASGLRFGSGAVGSGKVVATIGAPSQASVASATTASPIAPNTSAVDPSNVPVEYLTIKSFEDAKIIESWLPPDIPRMYIANRSDILPSTQSEGLRLTEGVAIAGHSEKYRAAVAGGGGTETELVASFGVSTGGGTGGALNEVNIDGLRPVMEYLQERQLPALVLVSSTTGDGIETVLNSAIDVVAHPDLGIPYCDRDREKSSWSLRTLLLAFGTVGVVAGITGAYFFLRERRQQVSANADALTVRTPRGILGSVQQLLSRLTNSLLTLRGSSSGY